MGKSGDLLRQNKLRNVKYTFTAEQLKAHDKAVIESDRKRRADLMEKKMRDVENEIAARVFKYMFPTVARIMVLKFKWKPAPKERFDRSNRLAQLTDALVEEYEKFFNGEVGNLEKYEEEAYELTGVKLQVVE